MTGSTDLTYDGLIALAATLKLAAIDAETQAYLTPTREWWTVVEDLRQAERRVYSAACWLGRQAEATR